MKIACFQLNPTVGNLERNRDKIIALVQTWSARVDLLLFPELALLGYPPQDLLFSADLLKRTEQAWNAIALKARGVVVLLGTVLPAGAVAPSPGFNSVPKLFNAALALSEGRVLAKYYKTLLPSYDVFDETRYFQSFQGAAVNRVLCFKKKRLLVTICEDLWGASPLEAAHEDQPLLGQLALARPFDLIINLSASPFSPAKFSRRQAIANRAVKTLAAPFLYVNQVGGNDALLFDGASFALDRRGQLVALAPPFREAFLSFTLTSSPKSPFKEAESELRLESSGLLAEASSPPSLLDEKALVAALSPAGASSPRPLKKLAKLPLLYEALLMGLRDYLRKTGFKRVLLGLSGGLDSALVAVLAAKALGPAKVSAVALPSRYSAAASLADASALADRVGFPLYVLPIEATRQMMHREFKLAFKEHASPLAQENLQARLRGNFLMTFSNHTQALLLATGNKSELAMGYSTLYGDLSGALAVIGDLFKTEVYALARWINQQEALIPKSIIDKPPSAELRPNQKDTDSLPPYPLLDAILAKHLLEGLDEAALVALGYAPVLVKEIFLKIKQSEYKRFQSPPVLRVSEKAFGMGRRIPLAKG